MKKIFILILFVITLFINIWLLFIYDESNIKKDSVQTVFNSKVSIYKTDNRNLISNLNKDEVKQLEGYLSKLSVMDNYKIKEGLSSGEENQVFTSFELMKHRLSCEDYEAISKILSGSVDIEAMESSTIYKN